MKGVLLYICLGAALLGLWVCSANAGLERGVTVDGDPSEWGTLSGADRSNDVSPDSILGIDIWEMEAFHHNPYDFNPQDSTYSLIVDRATYYFMFQFWVLVFEGDSKSSLEIFFDMSPEGTDGGKTDPWVDFYPDYRFQITGRNGMIESTLYYYWDGSKWVEGSSLLSKPPIQAAAGFHFHPSGRPKKYGYLEVGLSWESLGNPDPIKEGLDFPEEFGFTYPMKRIILEWAVMTSQAGSHDYFPDDHRAWQPERDYLVTPPPPTPIELDTWGALKSLHTR